jgi:hypothetical protein
MWNVDRPSTPIRKFSNFYVGEKFLDIASLDVYGGDFNQNYYDSLLVLAKGKPIVFGEVGNPPTPEVLKRQPRWAYYVIWAGMVRLTSKKQYQTLVNDSHVLTLEDAAYRTAIAPYRAVAGLEPLPVEVKRPLNFSGQWVFNEDASTLDNGGTGGIPYQLAINQQGNDLVIKRTMISEYSDNTITEEQLTLDGKEKELRAPFGNRPRMVSAHLSANADTLLIDSKMTFTNGGRTIESSTSEVWTLQDNGKALAVKQTSNSQRGRRSITAVYYKQ